jgi:hypothetical protein
MSDQATGEVRLEGSKVSEPANGVQRVVITTEMIRKIISNSVYRGMVRVRTSASDTEVAEGDLPIWEEYKGKHVAIVSDDLWARANARLKRAEPTPEQRV